MIRTPIRIGKLTLAISLSAAAIAPLAAMPDFLPWSAPIHLGPVINSASEEEGPEISKDGLSLYFYSLRAGGFGGEDLWVAHREHGDAPWQAAVNLDVLNTPASERAPALSRDGHLLFFASSRPGGRGGLDLWVSWREHTDDDFGWEPPVNLGAINTPANDTGPTFFENDESWMPPQLYFVSNRPGGFGLADIYMSEQMPDGSFGTPVNQRELNSVQLDTRPSIRHDGREIIFGSQRSGGFGGADLWVATRDNVWDPWSTPVNLGPDVNSSFAEGTPGLSSDGRELFFHSDRPGSLGDDDLWLAVRRKKNEP